MTRKLLQTLTALGGAILLVAAVPATSTAQVIDERSGGSSNPAASIFKATLYGVGTGIVVGGAFALVESDDDITTWDSLKWGIATGAVGGMVTGLVYAVSRSDAGDDAKSVVTDDDSSEMLQLELPTLAVRNERDVLDRSHSSVTMNLLRLSY